MRLTIKSLDCILEYKQTELEYCLEQGLNIMGFSFDEPSYFLEGADENFAITRECRLNKLNLVYNKTLEDNENSCYPNYSSSEWKIENLRQGGFYGKDYLPLLNKILRIDNPKYFSEFVSLEDLEGKRGEGIAGVGFFLRNAKVTSTFDHGEKLDFKFINYIHKKSTEARDSDKSLTQLIKEGGLGYHYTLSFIFEAIRSYDSFLKQLKEAK